MIKCNADTLCEHKQASPCGYVCGTTIRCAFQEYGTKDQYTTRPNTNIDNGIIIEKLDEIIKLLKELKSDNIIKLLGGM